MGLVVKTAFVDIIMKVCEELQGGDGAIVTWELVGGQMNTIGCHTPAYGGHCYIWRPTISAWLSYEPIWMQRLHGDAIRLCL